MSTAYILRDSGVNKKNSHYVRPSVNYATQASYRSRAYGGK